MRLRHPDGTTVHLALLHQRARRRRRSTTHRPARPVRRARARGTSAPTVLGVGLWLTAPAAAELADDEALERLRAELDRRGLEVVTLNGFPYRGFHEPVVKHDVYQPDWTGSSGCDYTIDLRRASSRGCCPTTRRAAASRRCRSGGARRGRTHRSGAPPPTTSTRSRTSCDAIEDQHRPRASGSVIEPEPGCVLETTTDAVAHLAEPRPRALGVCLDTCHLAVAFEDPGAASGGSRRGRPRREGPGLGGARTPTTPRARATRDGAGVVRRAALPPPGARGGAGAGCWPATTSARRCR